MRTKSNKPSFIAFLKNFIFLIFLLPCLYTFAQTDSLAIKKLRTESAVDPTRVNYRVGYSTLYFNKANNASSISNKFNVVLGITRWSFSIKPEIISVHNGISETGFETAFSDVKFSILNAFYVKDKNELAVSVAFSLPFEKQGFGSQMFTATPAITYSYT